MMAFTACIEPLRAANRIRRETLYHWRTLSLSGEAVEASNHVVITPDTALSEARDCDVIFICAGLRPRKYLAQQLRGEIRGFALRGTPLGAVCTGSVALAYAGVLTGYRCTIHWENMEGFKESYPDLNITAVLYEIDRNRYTCSGGMAPLDMMIYSIKCDHGEALARNVAELMLMNFIREPEEQQRMTLAYRTGIRHPKVLAAIAHMEAYIEAPLSLESLAEMVGLSVRQLERIFKLHLDNSPARYYLQLRLMRARQFLRQTSMSILDVAVATGFNSASHFSQKYKMHFGYAPNKERSI